MIEMPINRRNWLMMKETLVSWLVAVLLLGALIVKGLPMAASTIEEMYAEEEDKAAVGELEDKLVKLAKIDQSNLDRGLVVLDRVLPGGFDVAKSVSGLSRQAVEAGLEVSEYRAVVPRAEIEDGLQESGRSRTSGASRGRVRLERQRFNMTISGDWESWVDFLGQVDRIAPIAKVNGFQVSMGKEDNYDFELALEGYYYSGQSVEQMEKMGGTEVNLEDLRRAPVSVSQRQRETWEEVLEMNFSAYEKGKTEEVPRATDDEGG
jgi:hypothetical protein